MRWRFLKAFMILGCVATVACCFAPDLAQEETYPTAMLTLAVTHLVLRSPYRPLRLREVPLMLASLALAGLGAFYFRPEDEGLGFQVFVSLFAIAALGYGFFCSAVASDSALRSEVIAPTRRVSRLGLPGLDLGLVLAPFFFPYFWLRYLLRRG